MHRLGLDRREARRLVLEDELSPSYSLAASSGTPKNAIITKLHETGLAEENLDKKSVLGSIWIEASKVAA